MLDRSSSGCTDRRALRRDECRRLATYRQSEETRLRPERSPVAHPRTTWFAVPLRLANRSLGIRYTKCNVANDIDVRVGADIFARLRDGDTARALDPQDSATIAVVNPDRSTTVSEFHDSDRYLNRPIT